jgi:VWFA-related protein
MAQFALFPCRAVLVASLFAGGPGFLMAQDSTPVQGPGTDVGVIRTTVRRVVLDVVVTAKNGEPVRGLTQADFGVTEDNKPQTIRTFDVHDFDSGPEFVPPKIPPLGANTYLDLPTAPEKGPLYLILYDMWHMDLVTQPPARTQLLRFINSKPEGSRFAIIVLSDGMNLVQGFTSDKSELLATLDSKSSRPHVPQLFLSRGNYIKGELDVFTELAHYLEGFPGRKNVIWFSGAFPLSMFAQQGSELGDGEYTAEVKELVDTLATDQVSIYRSMCAG